ncbi:MAG: hypothetical protein AUJ53_09025 [Flavobacteriaceae bacterium CG1_02_35_72]|nr:MAG: hypothetical protein AUJ53_09025 [Flavobacteriaceae bacterium CG1_02_35_72]
MTQIDKFKDIWKNQEADTIKYSSDDIQKMIHKKSSSIVKWLFYISLMEFCFWILISFALDADWNHIKSLGLYNFISVLNVINYIIIITFIYFFYKNYKNISASSTTQKLMEDILKTRKTVYFYVLYNVTMLVFGFAVILYYIFTSEDFINKLETTRPDSDLSMSLTIAVIISVVIILVVVGILLLFYRLIYGILLKRLIANYNELLKN